MTTERRDSRTQSLFASRYQIERLIGSGGMGKVYLAHDTILNGQTVAVKVLNSELGQDQVLRKRFIREVQLTRMVNHPNVVRTFDVGIHEDQLFFSMEFVEGELLRNKISENPLDPMEAIKILLQICDGLCAIHAQGIIHRDLKSSNIIVTPSGTCKITDFGVAKPGSSDLTAQDELVGSATHMAPEVWQQGDVTEATDIYALGVIAYELLTGVLPFDGRSPHEFMWKHLKQAPVPPFEINPSVPRWLSAIVLHMLEKAPLNRPQTVGEVASTIKKKLRRATLENAQRSNSLGAADDSTIEDDPATADDSAQEEFADDLLDEAALVAYAPNQAPGMHVLTKASFSAQPAVISNPDDTLLHKHEHVEPRAIAPAKVSIVNDVLKPALGSLPRIATSVWVVIALAVLLYFAGSALFPLQGGKTIRSSPLMHILNLAGVTIIHIMAGLSPIIILAGVTHKLSKSLVTWLRLCCVALAITLMLMVWHAVVLASWSYSIKSAHDVLGIGLQALRASALDATQLSFFDISGYQHRVVPDGQVPYFISREVAGLNALHHLVALAFLVFSTLTILQSLLGRLQKPSILVSSFGVCVVFAMVWVLQWVFIPEMPPLGKEGAAEIMTTSELLQNYRLQFGGSQLALPTLIGWGAVWCYFFVFIAAHQGLARYSERKRQLQAHEYQSQS